MAKTSLRALQRDAGSPLLPTFEEAEADPRAIYRQFAHEGRLTPFEEGGYRDALAAHADERTRRQREAEDQQQSGPEHIREKAASLWNRAQADAAMGPSGWNRQWVPFFESMRGDKVDWGSLDLPTSHYGDPDQTGHLTRVGRSGPGIAYDPRSTFNTQDGPSGSFGAGTGGIESQAPSSDVRGVPPSMRALLKKVSR